MVDAGYDPREAPRLWKQMTKVVGPGYTDFFWSDHDNNATRRSYLMNEIRNNYSGLDYSRVSKGDEPSFLAIKEKAKLAQDKKKKIKVKS